MNPFDVLTFVALMVLAALGYSWVSALSELVKMLHARLATLEADVAWLKPIEAACAANAHDDFRRIERQAGVIVHDTEVYGQIIRGNEKRIAELEAALREIENHEDSPYGWEEKP
jgi:hypothetical protein